MQLQQTSKMKLTYHEAPNFGDALNPYIFNYFLPDFFDSNSDELFLGIGSILGLLKPKKNQRMIVFSSGYAAGAPDTYGEKPNIGSNYEVLCVRGPLTAKLLDIDPKKAIADGAILLKGLPILNPPPHTHKVKNKIGFIPHVGSLDFYDFSKLCKKTSLTFIDPALSIENVIKEIASCEYIVTEAMHGAIVADVCRTPWLPVIFYQTINTFKWKDYCLSMNLDYKPLKYYSLFSKKMIQQMIQNKTNFHFLSYVFSIVYNIIQNLILYPLNIVRLKKINKSDFILSSQNILDDKYNQLYDILMDFRNNYKSK